MQPKLLEIGVSHYCEKARWALEYCCIPYSRLTHLPFITRLEGRLRGSWSTVPVLFTEQGPILESTPIVIWADGRSKSSSLFGRSDSERSAVMDWLALFDRELGPATRRIIYYHVLSLPQIANPLLLQGVSRPEEVLCRPLLPLMRKLIGKGLKIDHEGAERSRLKLQEVWNKVEKTLGDGRSFLLGNTFSAADLSFAALASPVLLPDNYGVSLPQLEKLPAAAQEEIGRWRMSQAGKFGLRIYSENRNRLLNA